MCDLAYITTQASIAIEGQLDSVQWFAARPVNSVSCCLEAFCTKYSANYAFRLFYTKQIINGFVQGNSGVRNGLPVTKNEPERAGKRTGTPFRLDLNPGTKRNMTDK